jgi:pimeloyl-ACP methyl ester carboxylesterase
MQPRKSEGFGTYVPLRPPVQRTLAEAFAFVRPPWNLRVPRTAPRLDGRAVLVLPVIGRADAHTAQIRTRLDALGCRTFGWGLGTNYGPTPDILGGIERRLLSLHTQHGAMTVIGFSLGGIFARRLSHRHPDAVREVITVCSPFRAVLDSAFMPLRPLIPLWRTPQLSEIAAQAARPISVPGTFINSRNDGIVAWRSCIEPTQPEDCFEIAGAHVTITRDADVLAIIARRLARDVTGGPA